MLVFMPDMFLLFVCQTSGRQNDSSLFPVEGYCMNPDCFPGLAGPVGPGQKSFPSSRISISSVVDLDPVSQ